VLSSPNFSNSIFGNYLLSQHPSIQLFLCFPTGRFPNIWPAITILRILWLSILCTCPAHCNLLNFITVDSSGSPYKVYISLLYLIIQVPLSLMGPSILLSIFLSYEFITFYIFVVMTHVSLPCINTGRITVLYNRILVNRWMCLDQEYTQHG
jgi:hypothetical protein